MKNNIRSYSKGFAALILTIVFGLSILAPAGNVYAGGPNVRSNCCASRPPGPQ